MLGIFIMAGCVLMTCAGPPISGYTFGTLSGGRGQEYNSGYRTSGYIGSKDSQSDLADRLGGGGYASPAGSQRYSVVTSGGAGHSVSGNGYSSDSSYSDPSGSHSNAFGGHSSGSGNPDASSALSSSSYSSDLGAHGSSSDLDAATGYSSSGLGGYTSGGSGGNQVGSAFVGYSSDGSGLSGGERGPTEYSSSSHPSTAYMSYSISGPKASAYTSSAGSGGHGGHGHGIGAYFSSPSNVYTSGGHHGASSGSSAYSSDGGHSGVPSGATYSSGAMSLGSFLASMHSGGPSNYIHSSSGGHRGSPNHIFSAGSSPSSSYSSRGPSSNYFSSSPFPRTGGKIILVKEGNGHVAHMYPAEQHSYGGGMFGGAGSGYKIRSVSSSPSYGPTFGSGGHSSTGGYSGGSGHPSSSHGSSFFGFS